MILRATAPLRIAIATNIPHKCPLACYWLDYHICNFIALSHCKMVKMVVVTLTYAFSFTYQRDWSCNIALCESFSLYILRLAHRLVQHRSRKWNELSSPSDRRSEKNTFMRTRHNKQWRDAVWVSNYLFTLPCFFLL